MGISWLWMGVLATVYHSEAEIAHQGDGIDLYCAMCVQIIEITWYNQTDGDTVPDPNTAQRIAIYRNHETNSLSETYIIDLPWEARGVTVSRTDGHLHIPRVELADEGDYTWVLRDDLHGGVALQVYVLPSDLIVSSDVPMPVTVNTTISVSCAVDHIRPRPAHFYWEDLGIRNEGSLTETLVDAVYGVYHIENTYTVRVLAMHEGATLTCVVLTADGEELRKSVMVSITDAVPPTDSGDDRIPPTTAGDDLVRPTDPGGDFILPTDPQDVPALWVPIVGGTCGVIVVVFVVAISVHVSRTCNKTQASTSNPNEHEYEEIHNSSAATLQPHTSQTGTADPVYLRIGQTYGSGAADPAYLSIGQSYGSRTADPAYLSIGQSYESSAADPDYLSIGQSYGSGYESPVPSAGTSSYYMDMDAGSPTYMELESTN